MQRPLFYIISFNLQDYLLYYYYFYFTNSATDLVANLYTVHRNSKAFQSLFQNKLLLSNLLRKLPSLKLWDKDKGSWETLQKNYQAVTTWTCWLILAILKVEKQILRETWHDTEKHITIYEIPLLKKFFKAMSESD